MEALKLPNNVKVHFAGAEVQNQFFIVKELGVRYSLYTAFPFVERMVFDKAKSPIMSLNEQKSDPYRLIPLYIVSNMKHTIQDSGLFTLMFGAQKGIKDESLMERWYHALIEFTIKYSQGATCVEVDCQKVLGVEKAWNFRKRMRDDLPDNRIINVFHLEDGKKGLERLIEFSDYIAISVPELRFAGKKDYVYNLACYIKNKKPEIDIHLLGCTELNLLHKCNFCTSADSTSYISGKKYGYIKGKHVSTINTRKIIDRIGEEKYRNIRKYNNEMSANSIALSVELLKKDYQRAAGNQDYYQK